MMFLVIFSSLAAAMAIVAQGNLSTADTQLKVSRALAAAETGMRFAMLRINTATSAVPAIREGQIDATKAAELWTAIRSELVTELLEDDDEQLDKADIFAGEDGSLLLPPIALGKTAGSARFEVRINPHPVNGVNYDDAMYDQAPYAELGVNISSVTPLDARWVRVTVLGIDGPSNHPIKRAVQMDFKIDKKIRFALLSKNRVMIGPHVLVDGPVASRFMDTDLDHGHPVQMASDFRGLTPELDAQIDEFVAALVANDKDGDNRIRVADSREVENIEEPESFDTNGDGYIDEFDFFLSAFDANSDGRVSEVELETAGNQTRAELFELLDGHGSVDRVGYNDGFIDTDDNYAKVHGQVMIVQTQLSWASGAASDSSIQNYLQGGIIPSHDQAPLTYQASAASVHQYDASDFNVDGYRSMTDSDLATQAAPQAGQVNPGHTEPANALGEVVEHEAVPFGAAYPYDHYDRPVYRNMTFTNVRIPKGTNALFQNCTFIGVTFIETETDTNDPNYNYAGMQEADGTPKHPDKYVLIDPDQPDTEDNREYNTKNLANNIRFDNCVFEGSVVSDSAQQLAQVRNKIAFTGRTQFNVDSSAHLTDDEKRIFRRSALLAANYSVELGTYIAPHDSQETVYMTGTIVAGVLDIRGRADIRGTILTTFEPQEDVGPVLGETSPQFNTTLGYFSSDDGDLEAEVPNNGLGLIRLTYDPNLPLPDGILGPIEMRGQAATYREIPVPAGM